MRKATENHLTLISRWRKSQWTCLRAENHHHHYHHHRHTSHRLIYHYHTAITEIIIIIIIIRNNNSVNSSSPSPLANRRRRHLATPFVGGDSYHVGGSDGWVVRESSNDHDATCHGVDEKPVEDAARLRPRGRQRICHRPRGSLQNVEHKRYLN